jgi:hypothetical protein
MVRRSAIIGVVAAFSLALSGCLLTLKPSGAVVRFEYTGAAQTYTVPAGNCAVIIDAFGARGGEGGNVFAGSGGLGGETKAWVAVAGGAVLHIYVGGFGFSGGPVGTTATGGQGGFNGGGDGGDATPSSLPAQGFAGGGGGGSSDVRLNGTALSDRIVVAGGGGGGAGDAQGDAGFGGAGGSPGGAGTPTDFVTQGRTGGGGAIAGITVGTPGLPNGTAGGLLAGGTGGSSSGPAVPNSAFGGGGGGGGFGGGGGGGAFTVGPGGGGGGGASYAIKGAQGVTFKTEDGLQPAEVWITPLSCP